MNWNLTDLQTYLKSLPGFVQLLACCTDLNVYLVGGTLRDWILQRPLKDIDLVTPGDPTDLAKTFAEISGGRWFWLDESRCQSRVVIKHDNNPIYYDFSSFRGTDIASDLAARDFTINALAVALRGSAWEWVDPLTAADDFSTKILRSCSDSALIEDPLRCLRAVRFFQYLGFSPDRTTFNLIQDSVSALKSTPGERIHAELAMIFGSADVQVGVTLFNKLGLTTEIFGAELSSEDLNLYTSLVTRLDQQAVQPYGAFVVANGFSRMALIRLYLLFQATRATSEIQVISERLRLGRRNTQALAGLLSLSNRQLPALPTTERGRKLWLEDLPGDRSTSLLYLCLASGNNSLTLDLTRDLLQVVEKTPPGDCLPPLVTASEIQELLGIDPGPEVGKCLKLLRQAELNTMIVNRDDAVAFLRRLQKKEIDKGGCPF